MATRRFRLQVPAEPGALRAVRAFFAAVLEAEWGGDCEPLVLALDEACANVIRHRCPTIDDGAIRVEVECAYDRLRFRIGRFCKDSDVGQVRPRDLDDVRPGGLGTAFIAQAMDRVVFEPDPDAPGTVALVLEKLRGERGA